MRWMVELPIVDAGGVLMPLHKKMCSSALQLGQSQEGLVLIAPSSKGVCDDSMENGITLCQFV